MAREYVAPAQASAGISRYTTPIAPYTLTFLRVLVGIMFLLHGLPKLSGLAGFSGFLGSLGVPFPGVMGPFVALLEVVGGLLLIIGLGTRWVSLLFAVQMLVAAVLVKFPSAGFIAPQGGGAGAELDLLLMAAALVLFGYGAGPLSVDRNVIKRDI